MSLSIVVPVYNAENFLQKCMESILAQSYVNYELIAIDDGSTDSSLNILKSFEDRDPRIKVFHQENSGPGSARNLGIRHAKGDWIVFIDADDTVDNDYLKMLVDASQDVDLVLCGMKLFKGDKVIYSRLFLDNVEKKSILPIEEMFLKLRLYSLSGPVCKLFKRSMIHSNNIFFPIDMNLGEDTVFVYSYLQYANSAYILDNYHGYNVMLSQNDESLTKKVKPREKINAYYKIHEIGKKLCRSKNLSSTFNLDNFYVDGLLQSLSSTAESGISLSRKERYFCYNSIADLHLTKDLYKKLPFYFPLFKVFRAWGLYELLNKTIYRK